MPTSKVPIEQRSYNYRQAVQEVDPSTLEDFRHELEQTARQILKQKLGSTRKMSVKWMRHPSKTVMGRTRYFLEFGVLLVKFTIYLNPDDPDLIGTLAHEIAHILDYRLNFKFHRHNSKEFTRLRNEVVNSAQLKMLTSRDNPTQPNEPVAKENDDKCGKGQPGRDDPLGSPAPSSDSQVTGLAPTKQESEARGG